MFALKSPRAPQAEAAVDTRTGGPAAGVKVGYLSLDLETSHAPAEVVKAAVARWQCPSNIKDDAKKAERAAEAAERIDEKSALLDGAPISCVSIATDRGSWTFSSRLKGVKGKKAGSAGWHGDPATFYAASEEAMLMELRRVLDEIGTEMTVLLGWNVLAFDLPKLRARYVAHRLRLPNVLAPRGPREEEDQPVVDVMRRYLKYFSVELHREIMVSLREALERLGLPDHKKIVDGAQVPHLWDAGNTEEVLAYCRVDSAATLSIFLLLNGQGPGAR